MVLLWQWLRLRLRLRLRHWTTRYLKGLGVEHRLRARLRIAVGLRLELKLRLRLRLRLRWGVELRCRLVLRSVVGTFLRRALHRLRCCVGGLLVRVAGLWFCSREGVVSALLGLDLEPLLLVLVLVVAVD